ncbi:NUDIX domain-containing protein [Exiguobacterium sp. 17-1]|uniref:NUDIX domain-containing protein n=1 Tax=Exiguobacterium sp. 17-1 TaxID=2931981 RepID=UPI001FFF19D9|nr:NUDIX domain-containing protein [Exiguobacterium sp. 17-1]
MQPLQETFHRAFGTYGIYFNEGKLLVIHKQGGPYTYRYDLPGGSLEDFETLPDALDREFQEETGHSAHTASILMKENCSSSISRADRIRTGTIYRAGVWKTLRRYRMHWTANSKRKPG